MLVTAEAVRRITNRPKPSWAIIPRSWQEQGLLRADEKDEGEPVIDLFLKYAADLSFGPELSVASANLLASAGQGNPDLVEQAELAVHADPARAFSFDAD